MPPKVTDDYGHGQMMGMLVMIQFFESRDEIPLYVIDKIKALSVSDLSEYLHKPEEDVYLLIDEQLRNLHEND